MIEIRTMTRQDGSTVVLDLDARHREEMAAARVQTGRLIPEPTEVWSLVRNGDPLAIFGIRPRQNLAFTTFLARPGFYDGIGPTLAIARHCRALKQECPGRVLVARSWGAHWATLRWFEKLGFGIAGRDGDARLFVM